LSLSASRVEVLVWVLIYGGMLGAGIGIALERSGKSSFGWGVVCAGAAVTLVGVVLIWVRSRMSDRTET
jgi:hypothetical protein